MDVYQRSQVHSALGDPGRLRLVDLLADGDLTVQEVAASLQMPGNLLAHHLNILEEAGVVERRVSEGDRRRRYVALQRNALHGLKPAGDSSAGSVVFVCTHNSARSQFAAAYWEATTGQEAASAGSDPSLAVHPTAVRVASERGIDLGSGVPTDYQSIVGLPSLLVTVCDRAREGSLPEAVRRLHWSIPDPVPIGRIAAFRSAFAEIERRIDHLASTQ